VVTSTGRSRTAVALYAVASLLGGALLFGLEPLFVKLALPLFGGAPAVWNVAFGFFTTGVLAGYLVAHALVRASPRTQVIAYAALLLAGGVLLPVHVAPFSGPFLSDAPPLALLILMFERIGLPFVALAATAPLLQSWLARAHGTSDPYRLYAASNAGSLIALLAYPFAVEPFTGLSLQSRWWTAGYAVFALLMIACGVLAARRPAVATPAAPSRRAPNSRWLPVTWVALAAAPTLLTLGLTAHLTSDVASLPFVWTAPLAVYLLAFAVAFSGLPWRRLVALTPFAVLPVVVLLTTHLRLTPVAYFSVSLIALGLLSLGTLGRLAALRPPAERLTAFYLWIGLGGAVGALLGALVAPVVFASIAEYPIAIVLCCLLLLPRAGAPPASVRRWVLDVAIAVALVALAGALSHVAPLDAEDAQTTLLLWVTLAAGVAAAFFGDRLRFGLAVAALLAYGALIHDPGGDVIARERNFFGVKQVTADPDGQYHFLISGGTVHGIQSIDPAKSDEPRAYYARSGPLGDIFNAGQKRFAGRALGAVGLGIGAAACYRAPGQTWTFYEIDPAVVRIARDARLFTALASCAPDARIVLGDARLSLAEQAPAGYALLLLDAYDADQVPVHLLTREALALYLRQVAADGVLAFHISNRHFELAPVLAALASDAGLEALERDDESLTPDDLQEATMPSAWVVLTRRGRMLAGLAADQRWHGPARDPSLPLWTDDYSSLARVLRTGSL
jgi:hypothetical protein